MSKKPTRQQRIDAVRASIEHHRRDVLEPLLAERRVALGAIRSAECSLCCLILKADGGAYKTCRMCPLAFIGDVCSPEDRHIDSSWRKLNRALYALHYPRDEIPDPIEASRAMIASLEKALENELRLQKEEEGK